MCVYLVTRTEKILCCCSFFELEKNIFVYTLCEMKYHWKYYFTKYPRKSSKQTLFQRDRLLSLYRVYLYRILQDAYFKYQISYNISIKKEQDTRRIVHTIFRIFERNFPPFVIVRGKLSKKIKKKGNTKKQNIETHRIFRHEILYSIKYIYFKKFHLTYYSVSKRCEYFKKDKKRAQFYPFLSLKSSHENSLPRME